MTKMVPCELGEGGLGSEKFWHSRGILEGGSVSALLLSTQVLNGYLVGDEFHFG